MVAVDMLVASKMANLEIQRDIRFERFKKPRQP